MIGYLMPSFVETLVLAHAGALFWLLIYAFSSKITSSSMGEPSGRLATPKTRREKTVSSSMNAHLSERLPSQPPFPLGMNPGTPVSTTALNLTRDLIPSLISCTAS